MSQMSLPPASAEPRGVRVEAGAVVDLPAVEVIATAKESDRPVIILAPNGRTAEVFRRGSGLPRRKTVYATTRSVRGWTHPAIVVLPGFHSRSDASQIWACLLLCFLTARSWPERV